MRLQHLMLNFIYIVVGMVSFLLHLLFTEDELEVINLLPEVGNLVHVAVEAGSLLELTSDLIVGEVSVSALSDVNLISHTLVVSLLTVQVVELLSQLSDECILLRALDPYGLVSTSLKHKYCQ